MAKSEFFEALQDEDVEKINTMLKEHQMLANEENEEGLTPLGLAGHFGYYEVVEILLRYGANPNAVSHSKVPFIPRNTALHATIAGSKNIEIIRMLLKAGGSTEIMDSNGYLPIHLCGFDDTTKEIIDLLLEYNASTLSLTQDSKTVKDIAQQYQNLTIVNYIESKTQ